MRLETDKELSACSIMREKRAPYALRIKSAKPSNCSKTLPTCQSYSGIILIALLT